MSVPARRRQVAYGREHGLSARRACTLFSVARSALGYRGVKPAKDATAMERMRTLSAQYPRYGYRRIRILLARDGQAVSPGRAYRLWRLVGLQVPRQRGRKRGAASRPRPQAPTGPNQVWSYDFVFDRCANGQQVKCLTVTDERRRMAGLLCEPRRPSGCARVAGKRPILGKAASSRGCVEPGLAAGREPAVCEAAGGIRAARSCAPANTRPL